MAIFDLEGTLTYAGWREHLRVAGRFDQYHKLFSSDLARTDIIDALKGLYNIGYNIMILTAKPISGRGEAVDWLSTNGVPYDLLIMRPEGNDQTSPNFKKKVLGKLDKDNLFDVKIAFDDRQDIIDMYNDELITTFKVELL